MPGLFGSKQYRYVNPSAPIGTQIIQAAGAGFAHKYLKEKFVNIVFFGDGATSSSDFHSGLNFGAVFKTPTIFFCQNNHWAISVPLSKQTGAASLVDKASGYGLPRIQIDGNDILAVYHAVHDAAQRARAGGGPTFIEAITYRAGPHTSSDDPTRFQPKKDLEKWKKLDPITRFEKYLYSKNFLKNGHAKEIRGSFDYEINNLISKAEKYSPPPINTLFSDVYSNLPWHLEEAFGTYPRAMTQMAEDGYVKVIADKATGQLLGVQIIGSDALNLISEIALALEMGATVEDLSFTIHSHLTLPEMIMEAADAALNKAIHQVTLVKVKK